MCAEELSNLNRRSVVDYSIATFRTDRSLGSARRNADVSPLFLQVRMTSFIKTICWLVGAAILVLSAYSYNYRLQTSARLTTRLWAQVDFNDGKVRFYILEDPHGFDDPAYDVIGNWGHLYSADNFLDIGPKIPGSKGFSRRTIGSVRCGWVAAICLLYPAASSVSSALIIRKRSREGKCLKCSYDLQGCGCVCPECGTPIPPEQKARCEDLRSRGVP